MSQYNIFSSVVSDFLRDYSETEARTLCRLLLGLPVVHTLLMGFSPFEFVRTLSYARTVYT